MILSPHYTTSCCVFFFPFALVTKRQRLDTRLLRKQSSRQRSQLTLPRYCRRGAIALWELIDDLRGVNPRFVEFHIFASPALTRLYSLLFIFGSVHSLSLLELWLVGKFHSLYVSYAKAERRVSTYTTFLFRSTISCRLSISCANVSLICAVQANCFLGSVGPLGPEEDDGTSASGSGDGGGGASCT